MLEFGSAVANMALDVAKVQTALEKIKKVGGMELAIEAVVAGAFEIITKGVDASGRKAPPHHVQRVKQGILFVMKNCHWCISCWCICIIQVFMKASIDV